MSVHIALWRTLLIRSMKIDSMLAVYHTKSGVPHWKYVHTAPRCISVLHIICLCVLVDFHHTIPFPSKQQLIVWQQYRISWWELEAKGKQWQYVYNAIFSRYYVQFNRVQHINLHSKNLKFYGNWCIIQWNVFIRSFWKANTITVNFVPTIAYKILQHNLSINEIDFDISVIAVVQIWF